MARGQLAQRYGASDVALCNEEREPMATPSTYSWRRDTDGLGVWEHRGKVAVAGYGHSPVDRRWDGTSMDQTLGAYSILACQKAMDEAGVNPDPIYCIICWPRHNAGGRGGRGARYA